MAERHRPKVGVKFYCLALTAVIFIASWHPADSRGATTAPDSAEAAAIPWVLTYQKALDTATTLDRQVLLVIYTDWCPWCKRLDDSSFSDPRVVSLSGRVVFARVNAEVDTATAHRFRVRGYPTLVLTSKGGQEVDRIVGYLPPAPCRQTLVDFIEGTGTAWDLEQRLRDNPTDYSAMLALGEKYALRGDFDKAREQFNRILSNDPKNTSGKTDKALFGLARILRDEEHWYKAVEEFRRMIRKYPESDRREDAETYIPWLYLQAGDTAAALKSYREFLKNFKASSEVTWVKDQIDKLERRSDAPASQPR